MSPPFFTARLLLLLLLLLLPPPVVGALRRRRGHGVDAAVPRPARPAKRRSLSDDKAIDSVSQSGGAWIVDRCACSYELQKTRYNST